MRILSKRGTGFFLNAAVIMLAVISVFTYISYTSAGGTTQSVIYLTAAATVVLGCVAIFVGEKIKDWLLLGQVALLSAGFALFVTSDDVILSFVDYIFNIHYWGDTALIPNIITTALCFLINTLLAIAACFIAGKTVKQEGIKG